MNKLVYFSAVTIILIAPETCSLDLGEELKRESPLWKNHYPVASKVNVTWITSEEIWYFPFLTRSELVLWAKMAVAEDDFKRMSEEFARQNGCFLMNWKEDPNIFGFRKKIDINGSLYFNPIRNGVIDWAVEGEYGGTTYIIMTDNKSFVVGVDVFSDGSRGGYVMTPHSDVSKFSEDQVSEWKKKLAEVGFPEDSFVNLPVKCAKKFWENFKKKNMEGDKADYIPAKVEQTTASASVLMV